MWKPLCDLFAVTYSFFTFYRWNLLREVQFCQLWIFLCKNVPILGWQLTHKVSDELCNLKNKQECLALRHCKLRTLVETTPAKIFWQWNFDHFFSVILTKCQESSMTSRQRFLHDSLKKSLHFWTFFEHFFPPMLLPSITWYCSRNRISKLFIISFSVFIGPQL